MDSPPTTSSKSPNQVADPGDRVSGDPAGEAISKRRAPSFGFPQGVSSRIYLASLLGPLTLSASLGIQLVLAALLVVPPPEDPSELTAYGRYLFIAERDVEIFLASTVVAILAALVLVRAWSRALQTNPDVPDRALVRRLHFQAAAGAGGVVLALVWFIQARRFVEDGSGVPALYVAAMALLAGLTLATALLRVSGRSAGSGRSRVVNLLHAAGDPSPAAFRFSLLDVVFPLLLVALIYVPDWRQLSGRFFYEESLFHWDFFAMGPSLAYRHGRALGTDAYSMYGVGWPMVFAGLSRWVSLSYGRMIQIGTIYACVYLTGVYALLRLLVRRAALAALGTSFILLQFFLWEGSAVIWRFPSLTVLRWAFDVWCFIAVVLHWRTGRRLWAVVAGAAVGMALLFSTDTGLYLSAALGFYWLCTLPLRTDKRRHLVDVATSVLTAFAVLIAGLALASRGELLSSRFWTGWLEAILEFGGGFAQLPLSTGPNGVTVASFVLLLFCYLVLITWCLAKLLHDRGSHFEVFNGSLAVYGLLNLMHFVGRSGDYTTFRLWIPLALVLANLAGRLWDHAELHFTNRKLGVSRRRVLRALPFAGAAVVVGALAFIGPWRMLLLPVQDYPGLASRLVAGRQPDGLCVLLEPRDLCGLPAHQAATVNHVRAIIDRLDAIKAQGRTYAVVDETGSLFYLATDTPSFSRYPRIFIAMYTEEKVDEVRKSLEDQSPDFILTRPLVADQGKPFYRRWRFAIFGMAPGSQHHETWEELNEVIRRDYVLETDMAPFELWERVDRPG